MLYLFIYLLLCLVWSLYSIWIIRKYWKAKLWVCVFNFVINFVIFPVVLFICIKDRKFHWQGNLDNCKIYNK